MKTPRDSDDRGFLMGLGFFYGFCVAAVLIGSLAAFCVRTHLQQEAIDHGFASYNEKTGAWQWNSQEDARD